MIKARTPMAQAFRDVASQHSQREALVCGDVRATYGQLRERVTGLAYGLHELGIGKGDKVAAILPPSPEFVILFFALAELGAVIVPINPQLRPRQLRHILQDAEPSAVMISTQAAENAQAMDGMLKELAGLRHVISVNGEKTGRVVNSYNRRFVDQFPNFRVYGFPNLRDLPNLPIYQFPPRCLA